MTLREIAVGILRGRCPRCRVGDIYRHVLTDPHCPACGLRFEREPGYFVGSMYIGYLFGILSLGTLTFVGHLLAPGVDLGLIVLVAIAIFLPFVPTATRYARILWIYVDRSIWPPESEPDAVPDEPQRSPGS